MYTILLVIQYASVAGMLFEVSYISRNLQKPLHGNLFFALCVMMENNAGYLLVMLARDQQEALAAMMLGYLGRLWIPFALLRFVLQLCRFNKLNRALPFFAFFHMLTYAVVLTCRYHSLFVHDIGFEADGLYPHLVYEYGIWYYLFSLLVLLYSLIMLVLLVRKLRAEESPVEKNRLVFVTLAVVSFSLCSGLHFAGVGKVYDVSVLGYSFLAVFVFIALFRYDLLDTQALAQDFVIDRLSEGIISVNEQGQIGYVNSPAKKLFPSLASAPQEVLRMLDGSLEKGEPLRIGDRVYQPESNTLFLDGKKVGSVYVIADDTEHYRYMEQLEEQKQIAARANAAKTTFLSSMSHEIRTPINAVLGLDEMILRETNEVAVRGYARDIQSSGRMLLAIINDVLDFSKIEAGKMEIVTGEYNLSSLVADLVNMIESRAYAKGLVFSVAVDESIPYLLRGDDTRIKQCLLNLLTNAVKYTREGSVKMEVGFEKLDDSRILLQARVSDTGIGIKEEDLKRLYAPFERFEEKRNRRIEGTGLGMSIVKSLLAAMGSKIEVESEYGTGSTFSFSLVQDVVDWKPVGNWRTEHGQDSGTANYAETFQAPDARILVIDDTPMNLTVIRGLLRLTRIQIDTAGDGISGLEAARRAHYHIIFIDHLMPNLDGLETIAALRADTSGMNFATPCVALTANAVSGAREMYLSAGFSDYLSKPIDSIKLEEMIEHLLPPTLVLHRSDGAFQLKKGGWNGIERRANGGNGYAAQLFKDYFGLDVSPALKNCGTKEVFKDALQDFYDEIPRKADAIEAFVAAADWKNYTVLVHALKSSARLIGAGQLSELARRMEECGNAALGEGDGVRAAVAEILGRTPDLLAQYREYRRKLMPLCDACVSAPAALPPVPPEKFADALAALREFVGAFDFGSADAVIAELSAWSVPADSAGRYETLKSCIRAADQRGAMDALAAMP